MTDSPSRGRRWRRFLTIVAIWIAVMEIGLRLVPIPGLRKADLAPNVSAVLAEARTIGHPFLAYALRPGWESSADAEHQKSHNEWGYRGKALEKAKPDGVYRIVCLGGSSTYGHTPSSDAATWPARLERWLNEPTLELGTRVEVINGGAPGWSTFESAVNLAFRMVEWDPDLVIVYHTINDMRCALWPDPVSDNSHWRAVWPVVVEPPGERLLEYSRLYLVWRRYFTDYVERFESINSFAIVGYDPKAEDPFERGEVPERGFENFERNLRSIQAIAREHGADVMFVTQGCDERDILAGSRDNQLDAMARMGEILRSVAQEREITFVDAKTEMARRADEVGIDTLFTKEVHLTDDGADFLALVITRAILETVFGR